MIQFGYINSIICFPAHSNSWINSDYYNIYTLLNDAQPHEKSGAGYSVMVSVEWGGGLKMSGLLIYPHTLRDATFIRAEQLMLIPAYITFKIFWAE